MDKPGTYRLYEIKPTNGLNDERLIGRYMIKDGQFYILEDHTGVLEQSLPDGPMDEAHFKALWGLMHSGYFKIVHDTEINQGHHDNLIPDLDIGPTDPDQEYQLFGRKYEPERMQMFGSDVIINGQKVSEDELRDIMNLVRDGQYHLMPM